MKYPSVSQWTHGAFKKENNLNAESLSNLNVTRAYVDSYKTLIKYKILNLKANGLSESEILNEILLELEE